MYRALLASLAALLAAPAVALAAPPGTQPEGNGDQVTIAMFVIIIGAIVILAVIAAVEARRQK